MNKIKLVKVVTKVNDNTPAPYWCGGIKHVREATEHRVSAHQLTMIMASKNITIIDTAAGKNGNPVRTGKPSGAK